MSCFGCFNTQESEPSYGVKQQHPQQQRQQQQAQAQQARLRPQTPGATNSGPLKPGGAQQHARLQSEARVSPTNSDCTDIAELPSPPKSPNRSLDRPPQRSPQAYANGSAAEAQRLTPPPSVLGNPPPAFLGNPPQQLSRPASGPGNGYAQQSSRPASGSVNGYAPMWEDPLPPISKTQATPAAGPPQLKHNSPPSFKGFLTGKEEPEVHAKNFHDLPSGDMWAPKPFRPVMPEDVTHASPLKAEAGPSPREHHVGSPAELRAHPITDPSEMGAHSLGGSEASLRSSSTAEAVPGAGSSSLGPEQLTADGIRSSLSPRTRLPEAPGRGDGALEGSPERSDSRGTAGGLAGTRSGSLSGAPSEPGLAGADLYEVVGQLGISRTGVMKLMRDKRTQELVAAKWINHIQGETLSVNAEREIVNHRRLLHPNVIRFREVYATEEYLVIVMEYASGGHLGERIATNGALSEDKARKLFKMLVDGMSYCHRQGIVHRNLRLENMLLDGNFFQPLLKISGFAYSKAPDLDSAPKTLATGNPAYTPPEMLMAVRNEGASYDGRGVDVWSAGVVLFNMVTGQLPFQDPSEPGVLTRKLMKRLVGCQYEFPPDLNLSPECSDLISKILVPDPKTRIMSHLISSHPWLAGGSIEPPQPAAPIPISKQSESEISDVMERARRRRAAKQKAAPKKLAAFNEDLLDDL